MIRTHLSVNKDVIKNAISWNLAALRALNGLLLLWPSDTFVVANLSSFVQVMFVAFYEQL